MGHMWHINRQVPACGIPRSYREGIVASYSWGSAKSYQFDQRNPDGSVEVYQPFISWLCLKMPDLPPILLAPFVKVPREKPWNLGLTRWFIEHFIPAVSLGSMIWCSPKKMLGFPSQVWFPDLFASLKSSEILPKSVLAVVKSQNLPLISWFLGCFIFS